MKRTLRIGAEHDRRPILDQSDQLKLSIIIPSMNHAEFLEQTLQSLKEQRGIMPEELEVIVIDGGSSDGTATILKRWESGLIREWVSEPDDGQTDALSKGFALSRGSILGWLCSDDLLEPWTVREVLDFFRRTPGAEFVYGDATWIDRSGNRLRPKKEIPFNWFIWLHDHNYIPQPAAFWRRTLHEAVGGLDPHFNVAMDADLFARFAQRTRPIHVRRPWARARWYSEQKSQRLHSQRDCEDRLIRERLGVSFGSPTASRVRRVGAKAWRVGWKLLRGAYW
jgi:glycosyltransferase involved in cell wall biosynthesis